MKKKKLMNLFVLFLICVFIIDCFIPVEEDNSTTPTPYVYTDNYNMIKVPVPEGGIDFPIGINDDQTARVEKAFYIGEILVTQSLWDTVAKWAVNRDYGQYYGFLYEHHNINDYYEIGITGYYGGDLPIIGEHGAGSNIYLGQLTIDGQYVIPVWCNAFTDWYNEKYGTNFTPVYCDEYGNAKRGIDNYGLVPATPGRTGFRLPTPEEWELAARWNGNNSTNTVTITINGINFVEYPIKFTKGNSASGAKDSINNHLENDRVAIYELNNCQSPFHGKTKDSNVLGIFDMSGNVPEIVIDCWVNSARSEHHYMGGHFYGNAELLAIGKRGKAMATFGTGYSGLTGFRLVRNAE